ncbi:hypothetical protein JK386_10050 [Nocardioides sp. zg-536]|uniref:Uncharacterized protein n=1 Tax=Nocardioides faecalis TaxID=2803858 RepID=A0A938Y153_9ACTN|nr:hypothetical protein [Nocardioides faecalis]MBM9460247.1 hypothetical protein [Nocardioides faecalis]MBS4754631.1 hypothetical protein [Nocardioides faecalis]QVI59966.1 hypothetical protein KG111_06555 [Nocardioides faecalis]
MLLSRRRRVRAVAVDPATGEVISPWPFVGLVMVVSSFFLYAASGLLAPVWAVVLLLLTWLVMFALCFVWWRPYPKRVVALGVLSFVWWFVAVVTGGVLLDW